MEEKTLKKIVKTTLEPDCYLPRLSEQFNEYHYYRNSDSPHEGYTIPRGEFIRAGVPLKMLEHGNRFKLAILVPGSDLLPLIQGHFNKKGAYVTGPVLDYHEKMGHIAQNRLKMGDVRKGVENAFKVSSIQWLVEDPLEMENQTPPNETQSETTIGLE